MASKTPGRVGQYVHDRNSKRETRSDRSRSFEDLKVSADSQSSEPSLKQHKTTIKLRKKPAEPKQLDRTLLTQDSSTQRQPFYETDASQADATSITSTDGLQDHAENKARGVKQQSIQRPSENGTDLSQEAGTVLTDLDQPDELFQDGLRQHESEKSRVNVNHRTTVMNFPHNAGDSYPATSSGRASIADAVVGHFGTPETAHVIRATPDALPPAFRQMPVLTTTQLERPPARVREAAPAVSRGLDDLAAGFSYGQAQRGKSTITQSQRTAVQEGSRHSAAVQTRPVAELYKHGGSENVHERSLAQMPVRVIAPNAHGQPARSSRRLYGSPDGGTYRPMKGEADFVPGTHSRLGAEPIPHEFQENRQPGETPFAGQTDNEETFAETDYTPDQLKGMQFASLQAQPYDMDPNRVMPDHLREFVAKSLQEQMDIMINDTRESQALFLAHLPIEQWEQAGEWLLDAFRSVAKKLMDSRREKRKVALSFERAVESRYRAVSAKRKITEEALQQMKKDGGDLLAGTPKKVKRR